MKIDLVLNIKNSISNRKIVLVLEYIRLYMKKVITYCYLEKD